MPPPIALLLCILLIFYMLRIDFKHKSNVSSALWIPLIWVMIVGSRPIALWLSPEPVTATQDDYMSGNPIDRTFLIFLIVIGVFILSRRKVNWLQVYKNNSLIIIFIMYSVLSIMWSDFPGVAFKRWIKEIGTIIMILVVLTESNQVQAVKTLIRRCAYVLIPLSVVCIKYYPNIGRSFTPWGEAGFVGVTTSKNMLGVLCLVCGLYFFWNFVTIWRIKNADKIEFYKDILFFIMICWLLIVSNSLTSLICLIIGMCVFTTLSIIRRNVRYLGILIFHIVIIVAAIQLSVDMIGTFTTSMGRNMTFTDRTKLWEDVLEIGTNPLIGTGYESFWLGDRLTAIWAENWWQPNQAHNGYLEIYLNLGLIGLFLLAGIIVFAYRKIRKMLLSDFDYGRFGISFMVIILAYNFTEAAFKIASIMWLIFLLIIVDIPLNSQSQIQKQAKTMI